MPMDKNYFKEWRISLLKEALLLVPLSAALCLCMILIYNTDKAETVQECAVYYDLFGTLLLLVWSKWIKNEHELACYRKTTLTFIGLMIVWGCCSAASPTPLAEKFLFFLLVLISAIGLYPALKVEET